MPQQVYSVSQINEYIRALVDGDSLLGGIAVQGEISNYKLYPSGHHYFTLKDESSAIRCVMFKGNAFRMRFRPENGMRVIVMGRVSVYPRDGAYQLYCTAITPAGVGDLHVAFEQLKEKLSKEGLFDPAHKKALPAYPGTIGIVTSAAGAAVHDMIRILRKRFPLVKVLLFPVRVQGAEAPGEIAAAICYANVHALADLLIVGRGGGSIEDLWAFNDEAVARAIYSSQIPVISAVGHEPDVTISDYVADLRAATPSNAAELAVPDKDTLYQVLDTMSQTMCASLQKQIKTGRNRLRMLGESPALQNPVSYIRFRRAESEHLYARLCGSYQNSLSKKRQRYIGLTAKLDAMSPLRVLARGYCAARDDSGKLIRSVSQVAEGDTVRIAVSDGGFSASVVRVEGGQHEENR